MLRKAQTIQLVPVRQRSVPTALMLQLNKSGIFSIRICYSNFSKSLRYKLILSFAGESPCVCVCVCLKFNETIRNGNAVYFTVDYCRYLFKWQSCTT